MADEKKIITLADVQRSPNAVNVTIPETANLDDVINQLQNRRDYEETYVTGERSFQHRSWIDAAIAVNEVLADKFGQTWMQDSRTANARRVTVGYNKEREIYYGNIHLTQIKTEMHLEAGGFFGTTLYYRSKQKYKAILDSVLDAIQARLQEASIYHGQVVDADMQFRPVPKDLEPVIVDPRTERLLDAHVVKPIVAPEIFRDAGLSNKRSVVLCGDFGSGKTLAGAHAIQLATERGWHVVYIGGDGSDDLGAITQVMKNASNLLPALVFVEDIDRLSAHLGVDAIQQMMDSIETKGQPFSFIFTSNYLSEIPPVMLRNGRIDAVIEFHAPEVNEIRRLILANTAGALISDVDTTQAFWDEVASYMQVEVDGRVIPYQASAVVEVAKRSLLYATLDGRPNRVTLDDLAAAASEVATQVKLADKDDPLRLEKAKFKMQASAGLLAALMSK